MSYPTYVVADSLGVVFAVDRDGRSYTLETATDFVNQMNAAMKPEYRTWKVFELRETGPWTVVNEVLGEPVMNFPSEQDAAEFIGAQPGAEKGWYGIDGPPDDIDQEATAATEAEYQAWRNKGYPV